MTLASEVSKVEVVGDGIVTTFNYTFKILDEDHLVVVLVDADGDEALLAITTDYTVSGVGGPTGGQIAYPVSGDPLAADESLIMRRVVPLTQETDYENQGGFFADTHEEGYDIGVMADQQLQEQLDRALLLPLASDLDPDDTLDGLLAIVEAGSVGGLITTHIADLDNPHEVNEYDIFPAQTGKAGSVITTDGTVASWDAIPPTTPTPHGTSLHTGTIGAESQVIFDGAGHDHSGTTSGNKVDYTDLDSIPATFSPSAHTHAHADATGKTTDDHHAQSHGSADHSGTIGTESQITFDDTTGHDHDGTGGGGTKVDYTDLDSIPATFSPSAHTHAHADATGKTTDDHHAQSHGAADHSGTIGTESQITFDGAGHDHSGTTDGQVIDHADLANKGTNTHGQIDTHLGGDGSDHGDVATNTAHISSDGTDHSHVGLNDTHRGSDGTDHSHVGLNDTHRGGNGSDHANVATNTTHITSAGTDHSDVGLNNTHRTSDGSGHADVATNTTHSTGNGSDHANVATNSAHVSGDGSDHADVATNTAHVADDDIHFEKQIHVRLQTYDTWNGGSYRPLTTTDADTLPCYPWEYTNWDMSFQQEFRFPFACKLIRCVIHSFGSHFYCTANAGTVGAPPELVLQIQVAGVTECEVLLVGVSSQATGTSAWYSQWPDFTFTNTTGDLITGIAAGELLHVRWTFNEGDVTYSGSDYEVSQCRLTQSPPIDLYFEAT